MSAVAYRVAPRYRCVRRTTLAAALAVALAASPGAAQVTTERGASILIYPKVIADGQRDTAVQLANDSSTRVAAYCAYVDAELTNPALPPGPLNPPLWLAIGFTVELLARQPLHWVASSGRTPSSGDDPNAIPALPATFRGELLCVEVDAGGSPFDGDHLIGQATLSDLGTGDVAAYAAAGLQAAGFNDGDDALCLGGEPSDACLVGAEYDACPQAWIVSHPAEGAEDPLAGAGSTQSTRLTVVPCSQDLRGAVPATASLTAAVTNEFEQQFVAHTAVTCWADLALVDINDQVFRRDVLGSDYARTRLTASDNGPGVLVVAQTVHRAAGEAAVASSASVDVHHDGQSPAGDLIVLPMDRSE